MKEEWKPVKDWEDYYEVSNFGRVKSLDRYINNPKGGKRLLKGKIITQRIAGSWLYKSCSITLDGERKSCSVHRLVAEAFISNPLNKQQVNHIDGNKLNNHIENLEWCTPKENIKNAVNRGVIGNKGEKNGNSILNEEKVKFIKNSTLKNSEIAKKLGISYDTVYGIKSSRRWKHVEV